MLLPSEYSRALVVAPRYRVVYAFLLDEQPLPSFVLTDPRKVQILAALDGRRGFMDLVSHLGADVPVEYLEATLVQLLREQIVALAPHEEPAGLRRELDRIGARFRLARARARQAARAGVPSASPTAEPGSRPFEAGK